MNVTGISQRTLDQLNRMEDCLRHAGIATEYGVVDNKVVLRWKRAYQTYKRNAQARPATTAGYVAELADKIKAAVAERQAQTGEATP